MSLHFENLPDKLTNEKINETEFNYDLKAVVDIGLNGIRFSISSLKETHARILPCLYKDRAAISLFDTQNHSLEHCPSLSPISNKNLKKTLIKSEEPCREDSNVQIYSQIEDTNTCLANHTKLNSSKDNLSDELKDIKLISYRSEISANIIHDVIYALLRFRSVCKDFRVPTENIYVIATEAIDEASNSSAFFKAITNATGWDISIFHKSDEAMLKAYSVASSFNAVQGLIMDLGGGSIQISWISCINGDLEISENPVSLPYGSAALTRRLNKYFLSTSNETPSENINDIFDEIKFRFREAINSINIPEKITDSANSSGGFKLYVSGGGYRGLGNFLLSRDEFSSTIASINSSQYSYPIPIIDGYICSCESLLHLIEQFNPLNSTFSILDFTRSNTNLSVSEHGSSTGGKTKTFRVSERRVNQLPSVILLVKAFLESFPPIRKVLFSQDGIREGFLFQGLSKNIRMQDPLEIATRSLKSKSAESYLELVKKSVPLNSQTSGGFVPPVIHTRLLPALVNSAFAHSSFPKELQSLSALNIAILGPISDTHGLSHEVRALLGLALCQRWGGELPDPSLRENMITILSDRKLAWWALYCGHLMHVIGGVYPGGTIYKDISHDDVFSISAYFINHNTQGVEKNCDKNQNLGLKNHKLPPETNDEILIKIRANKSSPQTAAPMVRNRINNLEKKFKKLSKEFGKTESFKVHVQINWF